MAGVADDDEVLFPLSKSEDSIVIVCEKKED